MGEANGNGDKFLGLNAYWRQWANLGLAGVMAGLLVWGAMVTRTDHREDMRSFREEAKNAHGTMADLVQAIREDRAATKELAKAVRMLTEKIEKPRPAPPPGELELVPIPP